MIRSNLLNIRVRMKRTLLATALLLGATHFPTTVVAQSYSVDWYKIAGGGGTSAGGTFSVAGTVGQSDASTAMLGGSYALTGGFWSLISVVPAAGTPSLAIRLSGLDVVIYWPNTGSYTLQQSSDLASGSWTTSGYTITTVNGTNSITIPSPTGILLFRLKL